MVSRRLTKDRPILYHELVEDTPRGELFRQVYRFVSPMCTRELMVTQETM